MRCALPQWCDEHDECGTTLVAAVFESAVNIYSLDGVLRQHMPLPYEVMACAAIYANTCLLVDCVTRDRFGSRVAIELCII